MDFRTARIRYCASFFSFKRGFRIFDVIGERSIQESKYDGALTGEGGKIFPMTSPQGMPPRPLCVLYRRPGMLDNV